MNASNDDAVFFVDGLGLVSSVDPYALTGCPRDTPQAEIAALLGEDADPIARAVLASPTRRLAFHLLEPPETAPAASVHVRALRDGEAARAVAAHTLTEAIARETRGEAGPAATELWTTVDRLWRDLARSDRAAHALRATAERLGLASPGEEVKHVLGAVETELLPMLHLIFAAAATSSEHRDHHAAGAKGAPGHPLAAIARRVLGAGCLAQARRLRARLQERALRAYAAAAREDPSLSTYISAEIGDLAAELQPRADACGLADGNAWIAALAGARAVCGMDPRIHRAEAAFFTRCGLLVIQNRRFDEGGACLAWAAALDPTNLEPERLLTELQGKLREREVALTQMLETRGELDIADLRLLQEARKGMLNAVRIAVSPEARTVKESYQLARWTQLALRLGLDPARPASHAVARLLVEALAVRGEDAPAFEPRRAELVEDHPALDHAPWDAIRVVFEGDEPVTAERLLAALPAPPPPSDEIDDTLLRDAITRMREASSRRAPAREGGVDTTSLYPWLFSRVDAAPKLAAAAGVALLVLGAGLLEWNAITVRRRDSAYEELKAAVAEGRSEGVMRAARRFLDCTASESDDFRAPAVADEYHRVLLEALARAATDGSDEDVRRLLADARRLETWAPRAELEEEKMP